VRLLLDTHVVLWWLADSDRLGPQTRRAVVEASRVMVSTVVAWEMEIKRSLGKLDFDDGYPDRIRESGFEQLAITLEHAKAAGPLPLHHRDPFDRMLVAQARVEHLKLVTADPAFAPYGIDLVDARM
jgi:PIN domain nuclease of toxin-antitoxin system